jgi:cytochrome bd-type quinol oxidase subunit 1
MQTIFNFALGPSPVALLVAALVVQGVAGYLGHRLRRRRESSARAEHSDVQAIIGATMTLLALIIGFTCAMAISRYDERKDLEDAEAIAISTEYTRADLLPANAAAPARDLLGRYARQRILFYQVDDPARLAAILAETERLKTELWSVVAGPAASAANPITALVVSGMNDVLNSESRTLAAWRYHIPSATWLLMLLIAFAGNLMFGYGESRRSAAILVILPVIISIPFYLIADIDSPRAGLIRIVPVNLIEHAKSLRPKP